MKLIIKNGFSLQDLIVEMNQEPLINIADFCFLGFNEPFLAKISSTPKISADEVFQAAIGDRLIVDAPFYSDSEIIFADYAAIQALSLSNVSYRSPDPSGFDQLTQNAASMELDEYASKLNEIIQESFDTDMHEASVSFSGGVDCTLVAANLLQAGVKKLNLITVCVGDESTDEVVSCEVVSQLRSHFKDAEIDHKICKIEKEEAASVREELKKLKYVKSDVMNLNIATCHYFAAKNSDQKLVYTGTGADELFGGYHRLKTKMSTGGFEAVKADMLNAVHELPANNLYRDFETYNLFDKNLIHPFLQNNAIKLAFTAIKHQQCPIFENYGDIPGDKVIVRLALSKIATISSVMIPKKAIQFSTKIASLDKKAKGTDKL